MLIWINLNASHPRSLRFLALYVILFGKLLPVKAFPLAWLWLVANFAYMKSSKPLLVLYVIQRRLPRSLAGLLQSKLEYWHFLDDWTDCLLWRSESHITVTLYCDASKRAWGGVLLHLLSNNFPAFL